MRELPGGDPLGRFDLSRSGMGEGSAQLGRLTRDWKLRPPSLHRKKTSILKLMTESKITYPPPPGLNPIGIKFTAIEHIGIKSFATNI
jgi:hypothetical protein